MKIDRRITNGLAWAGAALVIAIPVADFAVRQFTEDAPRVAVVSGEPTPTAPASPAPVQTSQAPSQQTVQPAATPRPAAAQPASTDGDDAVDRLIQSGRPLPSYISDGGAAPAPRPTQPQTPTPAAQPQAPAPTPSPAPAPTASVAPTPVVEQPAAAQPAQTQRPRIVTVTMPTPVSQRPPSRPSAPVVTTPAPVIAAPRPATQPPLVLDDPVPVVTSEDLQDWESGPLDEFLANRAQQGGRSVTVYPDDYDPNGFFLDEGPNPQFRRRAPIVSEDYYYPFGE